MNSLYIGVGVAIILALVTALVGPLFVDWGTHRAVFEAEASRIVGLPVRVLGDVDARLLPSPRVRFGDVVVGDLAHPVARVGRFELDLDVAGLIRGETRVSELSLDRPALDLTIDADGRMVGLPQTGADLADVRIETVRFVDGRVRLVDRRAEGEWSATRVAGRGSVESLGGAWRLEAQGLAQGQKVDLVLASRRGPEGRQLRSFLTLADLGLTASGDLTASLGDGRPVLTGPLTVERRGEAAQPIVVKAALTLDPDGARFEGLTLGVGDEVEGARFEGGARARFGAASALEIDLAAPRLDLDGSAPIAGGARERLVRLGESLRATAGRVPLPRSTRIGVTLGSVAVGGGLVSDVAVEARTRPGGFAIETFAARLPGDTRLDLAGRLGLAESAVLEGTGRLAIGAPESLAAWWTGAAAAEAGIGALVLDGAFTLSRDGFFGPDLTLTVAGAEARGRVESRADGALRLGLTADRLDGARASRLLGRLGGGRTREGRALDLDLDVGRVDLGPTRAEGVRVALRLGGDTVAIDRLAMTDLAGLRVSGSGRIASAWTAPNGSLDLTLAAERPGPAFAALAGLASPEAARLAEVVGAAAGPLDLRAKLTGGGEASTVEISGRAAGGDLSIHGTWNGRLDDLAHGRIDARADLAGALLSPEAARLLDARPGEASILRGSIVGRASEGIAFSLSAGLGGRSATVDGMLTRPDVGAPQASFKARVAVPDASLLAALAGRPGLAYERRLPVDLTLAATGWGEVWSVSDLHGTLADTRVTASGDLTLAGPRPKATGRLRLDEAEAATLAEAAASSPLDFDAETTIDRLTDDETVIATAVRGRAIGEPDAARVLDLEASVGGATVGGDLRLRRLEGGRSAVSGRLTAAAMPWTSVRTAGRPRLAGQISGEVVFETVGADRDALRTQATGSGRLRLTDGRFSGVAIDRLKAPKGGAAVTAESLVRSMADGETNLPPLDLPLLIEKGRIQIPRFRVDVAGGRIAGRATIDPAAATIEGGATLEPVGEAAIDRASPVSHAVPSLDLVLAGPLGAAALAVDDTGLAAFLSLHALEREIETAEALRQDRIERLRFSTLLKRLEERRRAREAEAAKAAVPQIPSPQIPAPQIPAPQIAAPPTAAPRLPAPSAGEAGPSAAPATGAAGAGGGGAGVGSGDGGAPMPLGPRPLVPTAPRVAPEARPPAGGSTLLDEGHWAARAA